LSRSTKFSPEELGAANAWTNWAQFGELEDAPAAPPPPPMLTVEQIEATQKQAYEEAYAVGKELGFEAGQQEGYEAGLKQGREAGRKEGHEAMQQSLQTQIDDWAQLIATLERPLLQLDDAVEQALVDLVIAMVKQIVRREIKTEPGQIVAVLREAINALPVSDQKLTIHLHPDDAELVRTALRFDKELPSWRIHEDPLLTRGGCKVSTELSSIDATLENRLSAVIAQMLGGERQQDDGDETGK
jgi:flagellar assembly protein FliH